MKRYKVRVLGTELLFIIVTLCYLYTRPPSGSSHYSWACPIVNLRTRDPTESQITMIKYPSKSNYAVFREVKKEP